MNKTEDTGGLVFYIEDGITKSKFIPANLKEKFVRKFKKKGLINLTTAEIDEFLNRYQH